MGSAESRLIENPMGNLRCRPYMQSLTLQHTLFTIDYCAYGGPYKKPTNLWSNINWRPRGSTLTGRCESRCQGGFADDRGRWRHQFKIAQQTYQAVQGQGRRAWKEMVPHALHLEIIQANHP